MAVLGAGLPVGPTASAVANVTIVGNVSDKVGRPLEDIRIDDGRKWVYTDVDGSYEIEVPLGDDVRLTARGDRVRQEQQRLTALPGARADFELFYRILAEVSPETFNNEAATTLEIRVKSFAPTESCAQWTDLASNTAVALTLKDTDQEGRSTWAGYFEVPGDRTDGEYTHRSVMSECVAGSELTMGFQGSYLVDSSPPVFLGLYPIDGHNTIFEEQPIHVEVRDEGLAGLDPDSFEFTLTDKQTGAAVSLPLERFEELEEGTFVASSEAATLTDSHRYSAQVTVRDRAGNEASASHLDASVPLAGFAKMSSSSTGAPASIEPVRCDVGLEGTQTIATCEDVFMGLGGSVVTVQSSLTGNQEVYLAHGVSLEGAVVEWRVTQDQRDAYELRDPQGDEWEPRVVDYGYVLGDVEDLPSAFAADPVHPKLQIGTLRLRLPAEWAAAQEVYLSLEDISEPRLGACVDPLTADALCDTDPVWSRFAVIVDEQGELDQVVAEHESWGAKVLFVHDELEEYPSYEAYVPVTVRGRIQADSRVREVFAARTRTGEDKYRELLSEVPSGVPAVEGEYLAWQHPEVGVEQRLSLRPDAWSRLSVESDFAYPEPEVDLGDSIGPLRHELGLRPANPTGLKAEGEEEAMARGAVRYAADDGSHWVEVQAVDDFGIRFLMWLRDETAPTRFVFEMDLPEGLGVEEGDDDSFLIVEEPEYPEEDGPVVSGDVPVAQLLPPFALDREGRSVPVTQWLDDGTIVIEVTQTEDTDFPLLVDPSLVTMPCASVGTGSVAGTYMQWTGNAKCPYGITFVWANGHWPMRARAKAGGRWWAVHPAGDVCSKSPDRTPFYDFEVPCRSHDYGYDLIRTKKPFQYSKVTKWDADWEFREAMFEHCSGRSIPLRPNCYGAAGAYYAFVSGLVWIPQRESRPDDWPSMQFLRNRTFRDGTNNWSLRAAPGGSAQWAIYGSSLLLPDWRWVQFNCAKTVAGCSVRQDAQATLSGHLKGGEKIIASATLRCSPGSGTCPFTMAVWGRKVGSSSYELLGERVDSVSDWNTCCQFGQNITLHVTIPLNQDFARLRFEIYNRSSGKNLGIAYPSLRLNRSPSS